MTVEMSTLESKGTSAFHFILKVACDNAVIPYKWNNATHRIEKPKGWRKVVAFWFKFVHHSTYLTFAIIRLCMLVQEMKGNRNIVVPPRILVMGFTWVSAFVLCLIGKLQTALRYEEIISLTNALVEARSKVESDETANLPRTQRKGSWVSGALVLGAIMVILNPLPHALTVLDIPCAPHYPTSVLFHCNWVGESPTWRNLVISNGDNQISQLALVPFVVWDTLAVLDIMSIFGLFWSLVLLGGIWINEEMVNNERKCVGIVDRLLGYRKAQLMNVILNDALGLYLQWFPTILFFLTAILTFGMVRFTHLNIMLYGVFPACAFRCLFEALTEMTAVADMNKESHNQLTEMQGQVSRTTTDDGYLKAFLRSCRVLKCKSGSLYTLEKTIVLVSLSNCAELVFNLLIAYPYAEGYDWVKSSA